MLIDGVHGDQGNFITAIGGHFGGSGSGGGGLQNGNAGIGDGTAQIFALQRGNGCLYALVAHHIGVLSHGGQNVAIRNQPHDGIGLIEAHADHIRAGGLDSIACTVGRAFVAAEDTNNALGDVVLGNALGLGGVAFAVLGLQQLEAGALKGRAEAGFPGNAGGGSGVDINDADLAGGDTLGGQRIQHGFTGGFTGGGVVGGEGGLGGDIGGRVYIDDLHTGIGGFLQCGGNGVRAVGGDDDRLVACGDGVIDLLNLQCVVLGVGGHKGQVYA